MKYLKEFQGVRDDVSGNMVPLGALTYIAEDLAITSRILYPQLPKISIIQCRLAIMKFGIIILVLSNLCAVDAFVPASRGASAFGVASASKTALQAATKDDLLAARDMIDKIIYEKSCGTILVRLAWHDSGTFDKNVKGEWPAAGGAVGSIRFEPEINHGANAGLRNAIKLLEPVKEAFPALSYSDIFQMASCRAIETSGGPKIGVKYGRVDATSPEQCSPEGNLPDAEAGPDGKYGGPGGTASTESTEPEDHLRKVFYRMGFNDEEIVALSGAHTFGRWRYSCPMFTTLHDTC